MEKIVEFAKVKEIQIAAAATSTAVVGALALRYYLINLRQCKSKNRRLDDKIVIITGSNVGIGFEAAIEFAKRGANVVITARDIEHGRKAVHQGIIESDTMNLHFEQLDLSSLESIREFVKLFRRKFKRLDILINNEDLTGIPYEKTKDGFEMHFGVMHLGHFYLTNLLLDLLKASTPSRIINISTLAHRGIDMNWDDLNSEKKYNMAFAYAQSKLANALFTVELAKRLKDENIVSVTADSGPVRTEIWRKIKGFNVKAVLFMLTYPALWLVLKDSKMGAQTMIHCAVDDSIPVLNGKYFCDCRPIAPSKQAQNAESAERLWKISEKLVGLAK